MKTPVFLDTSAIYALANPRDPDHAAVRVVLADEARPFILHELILVEAFSLLAKRLHKQAALRTVGALRISPRVEKVPLTPDLLEAAWRRCCRFDDKEWDWVDCISFELMERRSLYEALGFDRHFLQAGFCLMIP